MYAVIKTGGQQHRVTKGEILRIEKLAADTGDRVRFDDVLLVAAGDQVTIGTPLIEGATVEAEVIGNGRADKVKIINGLRD